MDLVLPLLLRLERLLQRLPVEGVRAPVSSVCVCVCVCVLCVRVYSHTHTHTHTHTHLPSRRSPMATVLGFSGLGASSFSASFCMAWTIKLEFSNRGLWPMRSPFCFSNALRPVSPVCVCMCVCVACLCVYSLSPHFRVWDLDLCP